MNKKYTLAIDTTENITGIGIASYGLIEIKVWESKQNQSKELLPNINKLLAKHKIPLAQIKHVAVNLGPGSFTGLRIGISIANALGYGLNIPVVGLKQMAEDTKQRIAKLLELKTTATKFKMVLPFYGRPPHITKARPKIISGTKR